MKRFAANYIFPITSAPIKNGYVDFALEIAVLFAVCQTIIMSPVR